MCPVCSAVGESVGQEARPPAGGGAGDGAVGCRVPVILFVRGCLPARSGGKNASRGLCSSWARPPRAASCAPQSRGHPSPASPRPHCPSRTRSPGRRGPRVPTVAGSFLGFGRQVTHATSLPGTCPHLDAGGLGSVRKRVHVLKAADRPSLCGSSQPGGPRPLGFLLSTLWGSRGVLKRICDKGRSRFA